MPRTGEELSMTSTQEVYSGPAEISWVGRLDGGTPNPKMWRGKISAEPELLKARVGLSTEQLNNMLEELKLLLNKDYVATDPESAVRCIDGRASGEDQEDPKLGPQVPGATPAAVISYRLARFEGLQAESTLIHDLMELHNEYEELGLPNTRGAHTDEHSDSPYNSNTGCGALDKMLHILGAMVDDANRTVIYDYAKAIAGDSFDDATFESIIRKIEFLNQPDIKHRYFLKDKATGDYHYKNKVLESTKELGQGDASVEKLLGSHNEVFLIVNMRGAETLNRDKFASRSDNKIQAFNYDSWHTVARAKALFAEEQRRKDFVVSRAMSAVATAMLLTDGSLELGIRQ